MGELGEDPKQRNSCSWMVWALECMYLIELVFASLLHETFLHVIDLNASFKSNWQVNRYVTG